MLQPLNCREPQDLEKEKLLLLGLFLKERGTLRLCKLIEDLEVKEILSPFSHLEKELLSLAKKELTRCQKLGIELLYFREPSYPEILKEINYKPPFLYVKGRFPDGPALAIVGTRKPTPYGRELIEAIVPPLVQARLITVSGLARGIDTLVHRVTLREGGSTIAVLGTGLDVIYPPENSQLFSAIIEGGSCVISEFPLGTKPRRENFPRRNRIVSGLSRAVLVVEAGAKSGTLITAKWAQDQGRDVFVCPGSIFSEQSHGTHYLLKNGAIPVTSAEDILYYLGIEVKSESAQAKATNTEDLSPPEREVLSFLSGYPIHLESLLSQVKYEVPELLSILTELELKGLVKSLPGKFYQRLG